MLNQIVDFFNDNRPWLIPLAQFLGLILLTFVLNRNYNRVVNIFLAKGSVTMSLMVRAFYAPLLTFIYLSSLKLLIPHITSYVPFSLERIDVDKIYQVIILATFIWFVTRFSSMVKTHIFSSDLVKGRLNERMIHFFFELFYWTLILIFILGSLHTLQIEISGDIHMIVQGIIIWTFTLIFLYTVHVGVSENIKTFEEKGEFLFSVLLQGISIPLLVFVFGTGLLFFISTTNLQDYIDFVPTFRDIFFPCFFWFLFRLSSLIEQEFLLGRLTRHYPDKTRVQALGKLTRALTLLFAVLFLFASRIHYATQILQFIGGTSAIVVGIAAQTIIGNYLSGIIIHFEGNISVGDWIYSTDKSVEGVVEYIGMRSTTLRTLDKRVLYIPNSFFSSANIINATKMTHRRIDEVIPLDRVNPDRLHAIIQEIRAMLQEHPDIDHYFSTMAHLTEFGPASLNVNIRAFTRTKDLQTYRSICQDLLVQVMNIIARHRAGLAPTHILLSTNVAEKTN